MIPQNHPLYIRMWLPTTPEDTTTAAVIGWIVEQATYTPVVATLEEERHEVAWAPRHDEWRWTYTTDPATQKGRPQ